VDTDLEIDVTDLRELIAIGAEIDLVDVREPWEHEICLIKDSRPIPLADLTNRAMELGQDRTLVMICHHGMRSAHATRWLRAHGFEKAVNLAGGIDAWAREIDQDMPRY
jgi:rhodanese-related sulfurtransferase